MNFNKSGRLAEWIERIAPDREFGSLELASHAASIPAVALTLLMVGTAQASESNPLSAFLIGGVGLERWALLTPVLISLAFSALRVIRRVRGDSWISRGVRRGARALALAFPIALALDSVGNALALALAGGPESARWGSLALTIGALIALASVIAFRDQLLGWTQSNSRTVGLVVLIVAIALTGVWPFVGGLAGSQSASAASNNTAEGLWIAGSYGVENADASSVTFDVSGDFYHTGIAFNPNNEGEVIVNDDVTGDGDGRAIEIYSTSDGSEIDSISYSSGSVELTTGQSNPFAWYEDGTLAKINTDTYTNESKTTISGTTTDKLLQTYDGSVFLVTGGKIVKINTSDMSLMWSVSPSFQYPASMEVTADGIYVGAYDGAGDAIYQFSKADGSQISKTSTNSRAYDMMYYEPSDSFYTRYNTGEIQKRSAADLSVEATDSDGWGSLSTFEGNLYAKDEADSVVKLNPDTLGNVSSIGPFGNGGGDLTSPAEQGISFKEPTSGTDSSLYEEEIRYSDETGRLPDPTIQIYRYQGTEISSATSPLTDPGEWDLVDQTTLNHNDKAFSLLKDGDYYSFVMASEIENRKPGGTVVEATGIKAKDDGTPISIVVGGGWDDDPTATATQTATPGGTPTPTLGPNETATASPTPAGVQTVDPCAEETGPVAVFLEDGQSRIVYCGEETDSIDYDLSGPDGETYSGTINFSSPTDYYEGILNDSITGNLSDYDPEDVTANYSGTYSEPVNGTTAFSGSVTAEDSRDIPSVSSFGPMGSAPSSVGGQLLWILVGFGGVAASYFGSRRFGEEPSESWPLPDGFGPIFVVGSAASLIVSLEVLGGGLISFGIATVIERLGPLIGIVAIVLGAWWFWKRFIKGQDVVIRRD